MIYAMHLIHKGGVVFLYWLEYVHGLGTSEFKIYDKVAKVWFRVSANVQNNSSWREYIWCRNKLSRPSIWIFKPRYHVPIRTLDYTFDL